MDFRNLTPFPAIAFVGLTQGGEKFRVAALRQTFTFADGSLSFADEQSPLCEKDVFAGEPNQSSVLAESDLCPFKPMCDVVLNATAHAPHGRSARNFRVRLQIQEPDAGPSARPILDKTLLISGLSWIRKRDILFRCIWFVVKVGTLFFVRRNPWKRTRSENITTLPIRHEHALGGEYKVLINDPAARRVKKKDWLPGADRKALRAAFKESKVAGPLAWTAYELNPIGQGFPREWFRRAAKIEAFPAPQIEAPDAPFTARHFLRALRGKLQPEDALACQPQGFGIVPKAWSPRSKLLGTVNEAFVNSDQGLPEDFDFAYWNGAPKDQQVPAMKGNEVLILTNLCPPNAPGACLDSEGNTVLRLALPGHQPFLLVRYEEGKMVPTALELDTVNVDLEKASLVLVWRCVLPMKPGIRVVEARMMDRAEKQQLANLETWLSRNPQGPGNNRAMGISTQSGVANV